MRSTYYLAAIVLVAGVLVVVVVVMVLPLLLSANRTNERTTSTDERIDVRARPITVPFPYYGSVTGYHLFIVYTDGAGKQFICEALPVDPNTGQIPSNSTLLLSNPRDLLTRGYCQPYLPGSAAYVSNVASVTAATSIKAKQAYSCFVKETVAFNAANIPYHLTTGPNSNSYVRTLLDNCKVPAIKPPSAVLTPGWELSISFKR